MSVLKRLAPSLVATIPPGAIGEPVRIVTLQASRVPATGTVPAHCRIDGVISNLTGAT